MKIHYPDDLPVVARRKEIIEAVSDNQVVVISGDTGSGKTTQIPKICLELFPEETSVIGCTQPRRIAASSVSTRVGEELAQHGNIVGYKIRFHDYTTPSTRIKFMTDGVLLAETRSDRLLRKYKVIILDEAHERSLNIDFLLGYMKQILPERPDLKLIITSATIDTEAFARHFDNAPVISVSGRTYPVTVHYSPPANDEADEDTGYVEHCADSIINIYTKKPPGDILAFLPTEKEIRACCALVAQKIKGAVILPMFGRLQSADQRKIFQRYKSTKIVIATNVAETSITVPGIRYVVDSGLARMSYYNARAKTTSLPVQRISKASCDQRKGRCGRIGPGSCYRLYAEEDYLQREEFTLPEIKRSNLAEVILQMTSLNLGKPEDFPFVDPPNKSVIRDGYKLLQELGAISKSNTLTSNGKFMADLPIDPCISRILLEAQKEHCLYEIKVIASALAIQDPRIRPTEKEEQADIAHKRFAHKHSDFMTLLNIWHDFLADQGDKRSWSRLKKYCKANYLSFQRMREWLDLQEQLDRLLKRYDHFRDNRESASYEQIHKALATGFLRNIAVKKQGKIYQGASNQELMVFPGSHQFTSSGQWIIAASFLETNRLYALTVATIEPDWLESLAPHLIKRSWSNPRWNKKTGQVIADEKVALFGLIIVGSRQVNFAKRSRKNIPEAREIFIQSALIEGNLQGNYPFLNHNEQLINKWRKAEDKLRTTSIVHDDSTLFSFYSKALPDQVCDRASLNKYLKKKGHSRLKMSDNDIVKSRPDDNALADFPSTLHLNSIDLQLEYDFSPGSETDGMAVRIPLSIAPALPEQYFEWLVPGLIQEKVLLLVKGLPKSIRKKLVPVSNSVDLILDDIEMYKGSLFSALETSIHKLFRVHIHRADWPSELPLHLQVRFLLFDLNGKVVASGRNLHRLLREVDRVPAQATHAQQVSRQQQQEIDRWKNFITRSWDFKGLEERITLQTLSGEVAGYLFPYLVPQPDQGGVGVEFSHDRNTSLAENLSGVEYLYKLQFTDGYKALRKYCTSVVSGPSSKFLIEAGLDRKRGVELLISFAVKTLFPSINGTIPREQVFRNEVDKVKSRGFYKTGREIIDNGSAVLKKRREVSEKLHHYVSLDARRLVFTREKEVEFTALLNEIVPADYFSKHTYEEIDFTLRQLQSLAVRIERFYANPGKDLQKSNLLKPHIESIKQIENRRDKLDPEACELFTTYKKMVGEYRISVFSPEIKTTMAISPKKLQQQRQQVIARC